MATNDKNTARNQNTGHLGNPEKKQGMGAPGNELNDPAMDRDLYPGREEERQLRASESAPSRTYNEKSESWEREKKHSKGTEDDNWDANDPLERNTGVHTDEQYSSRGRYSDEEQNRYSAENDRRNREELE